MKKGILDLKFSVSICVYNGDNPLWFKQSMLSIFNQTREPDEVVLVVDGPITLNLEKVLDEFKSTDKLKIIRLEKNQGHGIARQIGLKNCSFDLIALMDADDIACPTRFEEQLEYFYKNPEIDIIGGDIIEFIDNEKNFVSKREVPCSDKDIKEYMKFRCPMNQVTVMFKKVSVELAGGYIDWYCNEDYYLWIRMFLAKCRFSNTGTVLVNVRVGNDMYRRRGGWKYFLSEFNLQRYMLTQKIIDKHIFIKNILKRIIVQLILPNSIRGWVFRKFARS